LTPSIGSTKDTIDRYFADLSREFDKIAANPHLRTARPRVIDSYFLGHLKRRQPLFSLTKITAKGLIACETVRGTVPPRRTKKSVAKQDWFPAMVKSPAPLYKLTEDNGRFYLVWTKPLLGPHNRFAGAVIAKIDLWDCFHSVSQQTSIPFLIRLNGKSLFSEKWKTTASYTEDALSVLGVETISVLTLRPETATTADSQNAAFRARDTGAVGAVAPTLLGNKQKQTSSDVWHRYKPFFIFGGIVVLFIIVFLLIRFYLWLNRVFTMRNIDRDDDDPFGRR
jgi:hypothetical protein